MATKSALPPGSIIPKLTKADIQLCYIGLGWWTSEDNKAPEDDIKKVRAKLVKMGAKP